jgi:holo-[acyl-carrier protein] synthase
MSGLAGLLSCNLDVALALGSTAVYAGIDRVELIEFSRILATGGDEFLGTVYTEGERGQSGDRLERLATRFAAKEAASKALGTGLRGISPTEIEVVSADNGQPQLRLHGRARERAETLGIVSMSVSLTHTSMAAEALVVALAATVTSRSSLRKDSAL